MRPTPEFKDIELIDSAEDPAGVHELAKKRRSGMWWLVFVVVAVLAGALLAIADARETRMILEKATNSRQQSQTALGRVLVVVNNPDRRMQVVATLSPRGLDPVIADNPQQVDRQLAAHGDAIRMAVIDGSVASAAAIARKLDGKLAPQRIVILSPDARRESIGQILLDRL